MLSKSQIQMVTIPCNFFLRFPSSRRQRYNVSSYITINLVTMPILGAAGLIVYPALAHKVGIVHWFVKLHSVLTFKTVSTTREELIIIERERGIGIKLSFPFLNYKSMKILFTSSLIKYFHFAFFVERSFRLCATKRILLLSVPTAYTGNGTRVQIPILKVYTVQTFVISLMFFLNVQSLVSSWKSMTFFLTLLHDVTVIPRGCEETTESPWLMFGSYESDLWLVDCLKLWQTFQKLLMT